jgi:hypothetical protein
MSIKQVPTFLLLCLQEYVTLPPAFYLELDLEQQVLVERASSNPFTLLTSGLHQLELQQLIQVSSAWLHFVGWDCRNEKQLDVWQTHCTVLASGLHQLELQQLIRVCTRCLANRGIRSGGSNPFHHV